MANKVQKIREEVEKLKSQLLRGACSSQVAMETRCKEEAYNEVLGILDTMQEEPISEDWGKCTNKILLEGTNFNKSWYAHPELALEAGAKWQKEQMMAKAVDATVHIDAGGYPYIPQMELYDYEKDIPLAKEGDKYKAILIKEI